jgi:AcrR family transcriptional regulator
VSGADEDVTGADSAVERLLAAELAEAGRRPRADAVRNMGRLVDAARDAVAEIGVEVTAHEIARRAGVGIGTFYRRLPSREALLSAVLVDTIDEIIAIADAALADADPWAGLCTFAEAYVGLRATSCGINDALGGRGGPDLEPQLARLREQIRQLVTRAQAAGVLRADVVWTDVPFLLAGVIPAEHTIGLAVAPRQWERNLRILLDGLATARPSPLPDGTPLEP